MSVPSREGSKLIVVGWHECIALPELEIEAVFAKLDTGSDHSVLHVTGLVAVGPEEVEFTPPLLRRQKDCRSFEPGGVRRVRMTVVEERIIRSSNRSEERRPVVETVVRLGTLHFGARFSLANRETMRFAALLGRSALSGRVLVASHAAHLTTPSEPCTFAETDPAR